MKFLEKDLEDIICDNELSQLREKGLDIGGKIKRQVTTKNGIADIVSIEIKKYLSPSHRKDEAYFEISIFELKKEIIDTSTLTQAMKYLNSIVSSITEKGRRSNYFYRIVLVGYSVNSEMKIWIEHFEKFLFNYEDVYLEIYTYSIDINGIKFTLYEG